jgi:hypothetical protein
LLTLKVPVEGGRIFLADKFSVAFVGPGSDDERGIRHRVKNRAQRLTIDPPTIKP